MNAVPDPNAARKAWMSLLAKSPAPALDALFRTIDCPGYDMLRAAEIGSVMVRGRAGAVGAAFNLGEMTVTRCSVKLDDGTVGHGYVQGRDKTHARQAALLDALMQTEAAEEIDRAVLAPLRSGADRKKAERAARAAATKVDFFTLMRGED